jgi:uncharacterized cupredoxin-like copper-binding protein
MPEMAELPLASTHGGIWSACGGFMIRRIAMGATLLALVSAAPAAADEPATGKPGDMAKASRTVEVRMSDTMRFTPDRIDVKPGETIHFIVVNTGQVRHEFVFGTAAHLRAHAAVMSKHPDMVHEDPGHYTVEPGRTAEFAWQFTKQGVVDFACLLPGHFDAGMRGTIVVRK